MFLSTRKTLDFLGLLSSHPLPSELEKNSPGITTMKSEACPVKFFIANVERKIADSEFFKKGTVYGHFVTFKFEFQTF